MTTEKVKKKKQKIIPKKNLEHGGSQGKIEIDVQEERKLRDWKETKH